MKIITTETKTENERSETIEIKGFDGLDSFKLIMFVSAALFLIPYLIHFGWLFAEKTR